MLPNAILFDLDDTLFDHHRASTRALRVLHAEYAYCIDFATFADKHGDVLEEFHQHFLSGQFTLDQARIARMKVLFAAFGRPMDDLTARRAARLYREQHQANRAVVPGARELLEALRGQVKLGIVTNNSTLEQHEKLRALEIAHYFDTIVISEDVGATKPDRRIFGIALERAGATAEETVFVGDSWQNDVLGAIDSGIAAVWFNRHGKTETQALERRADKKRLEKSAAAGVSQSIPVELRSFTPLSTALSAIRKAFKNRTPGVTKNEQLETLAP